MTLGQYVINFLLWLDEGANALMGYNAHETISERAALARQDGKRWGCVVCKILDWLSADHCAGALRVASTAPVDGLKNLK